MNTDKGKAVEQQENKTYHLKLGTGEVQEYIYQTELGSGSTGNVYLVRDASDKPFALKICKAFGEDKSRQQESFKKNAKELMSDQISGFIPVSQIGICEEENQPAMLMEYGGKDLEWTLRVISSEDVDTELKKAFEYKVLLNVIGALSDAHHKNKYHQDILPRNILCGICPEYAPEDSEEKDKYRSWLEEAIIDGTVRLTDRRSLESITNDMESIHDNPSFTGGSDLLNAVYFKLLRDSTPSEKDIYACLALYSLLKDPSRSSSVWEFAYSNELLEIDDLLDVEKEKKRFKLPSLDQLKEKLEREIGTDEYFQIETVDNLGGSGLIVTRPIDRFTRTWKAERLVDYDELKSFFKSHDSSFQKLYNLAAGIMKADEKERIRNHYESLILEATLKLDNLISQKHEKRKPLEYSIVSNLHKIRELSNQIDKEAKNSTEQERLLREMVGKLGADLGDTNLIHKIEEQQRKYNALRPKIKKLEEEKGVLEKENGRDESSLKTEEFNFERQHIALGYIATICREEIRTSGIRTKVEDKLRANQLAIQDE